MQKYTFVRRTTLSLCLGGVMAAAPLPAVTIDLNEFFADPTVSISADGTMATLSEEAGFFTVILELDPSLGDPDLIIPMTGTALRFEYEFNEPADNDDLFIAYLIDASTSDSLGGMFEFTANETSSGTISWNLSSLVGDTLGLHFELATLPADLGLDSTLIIRNVEIVEVNGPVIPEGSTISLLLGGLALIGLRRRRA